MPFKGDMPIRLGANFGSRVAQWERGEKLERATIGLVRHGLRPIPIPVRILAVNHHRT
jgi:hypothetical protein